MPSVSRRLFLIVVLFTLNVFLAGQIYAQPDGVPLPDDPDGDTLPPSPQTPPRMQFQPPAQATHIRDLASPDARQIILPDTANQRAIAAPQQRRDTLLTLSNKGIGLFVEAGTFPHNTTIEIGNVVARNALRLERANAFTAALISPEIEQLIEFELNAFTSGGRQENFERPVRIIVDMRTQMVGADLSGGDFYLAYRDETNPNLWHDVPILVHQETGLISAEVNHFSEWTAGWRPAEPDVPSWNPPAAAGFSGAAAYSYPIDVPPGRNGLQPTVSISYNSRSLDGSISSAGGGSVGTGWSLSEIFVVRTGIEIKSVNNDIKLVHPDRFRLVLEGTGYELVPEGNTTSNTVRYHVKDNPGLRVYRYYRSDTPNTDGIFWVVQTTDGVQYRLGYYADAEQWHRMVKPQDGDRLDISGHSGHIGTGEEIRTSAIGWYVDTVTDLYGNQIAYRYNNDTVTKYRCTHGDHCGHDLGHDHHKVRIAAIEYNFSNRVQLNTDGTIPYLDGSEFRRLLDDPNNIPATRITFHARGQEYGKIQNI